MNSEKKTKVEEVEDLIHDLAKRKALEYVEREFAFDQSRGSGPGARGILRRYKNSYEYNTMLLRCRFGLISSQEFRDWEDARRKVREPYDPD